MAEGNCDDALRELYGYLDGQLTDDRRAAIQRHLDDCPPCLEAKDFEVELRAVIAKKCRDTVPEQLKLRILGVIEQERSGPGG